MGTPGRILIVDDEPPLLKMMGVYLTRKGFTVTTSERTDEAWKLVQAEPGAYSVAVLDGSMEGMSMEELAQRLLSANPDMCVLAASGYPLDMSKLKEAAPGRVAFLLKPFSPEALATAVRGLIGKKEKDV